MTTNSLSQITVPFHSTELYLVEHNGQPYTPMKPIVEGMGLDWKSQYAKTKTPTTTEVTQQNEENKAGLLLYFAQEQIKQSVKDPSSVQFRGEQLHEKTKYGAVACGQVNAKNSFGAYTGYKGFVVTEKDMIIYIEDGVNAKTFASKWNELCVSK